VVTQEQGVWLKSGDRNSKKNHKFAENRKNYNTIWDVLDEEGNFNILRQGLK
jgi:hypothetical protein